MAQWYHYLSNPGKRSLDRYEHIVQGNVVVRKTEQGTNTYAVLQSPAHFYGMVRDADHKSFYEVFKGEQKPHFDIDITDMSVDGDQLVRDVHAALKQVIKQPFGFAVYTSHTPLKQSYHIVLTGVCVADHTKSMQLYHIVCNTMTSADKQHIDRAVYSSRQNFRALGCHKDGVLNVKAFSLDLSDVPSPPPGRQSGESLNIFRFQQSLVGFTVGCTELSLPATPQRAAAVATKTHTTAPESYQPIVTEVLAMLERRMPESNLTITSLKEGVGSTRLLAVLSNNGGYWCYICGRVHEKENPFIDIKVGNTVYFNCRRHPGGSCVCGVIRGVQDGW